MKGWRLSIAGIPALKNKFKMKTNYNFTEGWFSGFSQSDGCFTIAFEKRKSGLLVRPKPIFVLTQDISELDMFKKLHLHVGIGYITKSKINVSLYVTSLADIKNVLFPIFDKHPLRYGKRRSYLIFKHVVNMMLNKEHLKLEGLLSIIHLSFWMNKETSTRTEESKTKLIDFLRDKHGELPEYKETSITNDLPIAPMSLDFITGLIDGDGSFNVSFQLKPYRRVKINFTVVQETSCKEVLNELKAYFGCGKVYDLPSSASRYQVENQDLIMNNIAPILNNVKFNTEKSEYYKATIKAGEILKTEGIKSDESFKTIIDLVYDINKSGKRRRLTKQEFIEMMMKS
uniref:LAGLIDADG endonuclease n=1 Tax=Morchella brunnea TaxID=1174671 RepID=A0A8K1I848_9PEZI|nr:LAGLIDADG endonuclease [Morchella brunnea]UBU98482.1 LAGLIDADG endonuclease [Morchella brunnea]